MLSPIKILIVEDNPLDADLAVRELGRSGFDVEWHCVDNEEEFVSRLDSSLDLIISDYGLPGFSGLRALELRNQLLPALPFIIVSGVIGEDFAVEAMHQGATDYLLKDRLARIGTAVRNSLEQSRLRQETQRATDSLRESEELFSKAFRLSPDGILIVRIADQRILLANAALHRLFGVSTDDVIGRSTDEFARWISEEERSGFVGTVQARGELRDYETRLRLLDGRVLWFNLSSRLITIGGQACTLSVMRDITDRRQAEENLRNSEERFRAAFESADMGIIFVAQDRAFLRVNRAFCRITGYTAEELLTMTTRDISPPEDLDADWEQVRLLPRGAAPRGAIEKRYLCKDGKTVWVSLTISLIRQTEGAPDYFVGMVEDLTQRRSLEAQLRQAQKMEAIGQLAGSVAHDFNNMLTAIMGHATLITMRGGLLGETKDDLNQINEAAERAARLTQQLLLFSRRDVIQTTVLNLNDSVTSLSKMLQRLIGEAVRLQMRLHPRSLSVNADRGMIDQVLMNLAINARDAMPKGGELTIETAEQAVLPGSDLNAELQLGAYACISVIDTGGGIAPDVLPRIFEPFFTTKEVGKGTGLGLATVFGIVKQHHGAVKVRSELGRGAVFQVLLPLCRETVASSASEIRSELLRGRGEAILLVEDDVGVHKMTKSSLESSGYRVVSATTGPAALQIWDRMEGNFDLLLTDMVLPGGLSGDELALRFRGRRPELAVVLMSGYSAKLIDAELSSAERLVYMPKPFEVANLLAVIHRLLNSKG